MKKSRCSVTDGTSLSLTPDSARNLSSMHASLIRKQLGGLIPPKIATPTILVSLFPLDPLFKQSRSALFFDSPQVLAQVSHPS
jgi:hypothetical protein